MVTIMLEYHVITDLYDHMSAQASSIMQKLFRLLTACYVALAAGAWSNSIKVYGLIFVYFIVLVRSQRPHLAVTSFSGYLAINYGKICNFNKTNRYKIYKTMLSYDDTPSLSPY